MSSKDLARWAISEIKRLQLGPILVCSGARNSPLVIALEEFAISSISFVSEESAGFYAVGLAQNDFKPVVITSSGTAVAQLLAPAIEAFYDNRFILFLTADRPKSYRSSGAPQSIEQNGIFGSYCSNCLDIDEIPNNEIYMDDSKPMHINLCFENPLNWQAEEQTKYLSEKLIFNKLASESSELDLVGDELYVISRLTDNEVPAVEKFLKNNSVCVLLEASSQIGKDFSGKAMILKHGEKLLKSININDYFSKVVHFGGVPTTRLWRDLAETLKLEVESFGRGEFSGIPGVARVCGKKLLRQCLNIEALENKKLHSLKKMDDELQDNFLKILKDKPSSEARLYSALIEQINSDDSVYLGNSMPIRMYDLCRFPKAKAVYANRGANGIDGQINSFLGSSFSHKERSIAILGDLTSFYDLGGLWAHNYATAKCLILLIMNNSGGMIFKRTKSPEKMLSRHQINFSGLEKFYPEFKYQAWTEIKTLPVEGKYIIEIFPDEMQSDQFWQDWEDV